MRTIWWISFLWHQLTVTYDVGYQGGVGGMVHAAGPSLFALRLNSSGGQRALRLSSSFFIA